MRCIRCDRELQEGEYTNIPFSAVGARFPAGLYCKDSAACSALALPRETGFIVLTDGDVHKDTSLYVSAHAIIAVRLNQQRSGAIVVLSGAEGIRCKESPEEVLRLMNEYTDDWLTRGNNGPAYYSPKREE